MNSIWFIIWLIGAIVSTYITYKYAEPIDMYKRIFKYNKGKARIAPTIGISIVIISYTCLSWIGAIATYVCFTDFGNKT